MADIWPAVHAERRALADDLAGLSPEQWSTPSLCDGWSVQDVLAHLVATAKMTPPSFFLALARTGFRFNAMSARLIAVERGSSGADVLGRFRSVLTRTSHPPGPATAMVGEQVVHAEDIRRPLGLSHDYPVEMLVTVAGFFTRSNLLIGGKSRAAGLHLRATDAQWSAGTGPEVAGPLLDLVLAITGRKAALANLSGDGAATLAARS